MELFPVAVEHHKRKVGVMPDPYRTSSSRPTMDGLIQQIQTLTSTIAKLEKQIDDLDRQVREGGYISRTEFVLSLSNKVDIEGRYWLVEKLVFGASATILLAALAGVLYILGWGKGL